MGGTNKSIFPLNKVSDSKKKVLFTLNVFQKPFGWVVLYIYIYIYIYIVYCILRLYNCVIENEIKIYLKKI